MKKINNQDAWETVSDTDKLLYLSNIAKAKASGRTIQLWVNEEEWCDIENPFYLLEKFYRIKPQLGMIPLDFADILDIAYKWIVVAKNGERCYITGGDVDRVWIRYAHTGCSCSYEDLRRDYTRLDGSRFEKEVTQ